jgi:hypothetical protein
MNRRGRGGHRELLQFSVTSASYAVKHFLCPVTSVTSAVHFAFSFETDLRIGATDATFPSS